MSDENTQGPDAAKAEIARIRGEAVRDVKHAYNDRFHPQHQATVDRMAALHAAAYPEPAAAETPAAKATGAGENPAGLADFHDGMVVEPGSKLGEIMAEAMTSPETPDDYDLNRVAIPEEADPADVVWWTAAARHWFHEGTVTQQEANKLIESFNRLNSDPKRDDPVADEQRTQEGQRVLRGMWGGDFDANLSAAKRAVDRLGGDPLWHFLNVTRLCNDPWVVRALAEAAKRKNW